MLLPPVILPTNVKLETPLLVWLSDIVAIPETEGMAIIKILVNKASTTILIINRDLKPLLVWLSDIVAIPETEGMAIIKILVNKASTTILIINRDLKGPCRGCI